MAKLDKQDQRIANIFGTQDIPEVDTETLERYLDAISTILNSISPCPASSQASRILTGKNITSLDQAVKQNMSAYAKLDRHIWTRMTC
jgi:hypothetical protein